MNKQTREIVIPSQLLGDVKNRKAGRGTFIENGKIYSCSGVLSIKFIFRYAEQFRGEKQCE